MILKRTHIILLIGAIAALTGCHEKKKIGLANPASQNCIDKGGTLQNLKRGDGGEYGVCYFEDNRQCEEWALFHKSCPVGGIKITGYLTQEAVYCAITGGHVFENETVCQLHSGKRCSTSDVFNGKCS
jgi:putative hemolysin